MARSVLQDRVYTLSSELKSSLYVIVFLAVHGAAHWGKKPVGPAALSFKVQSFSDQESFDRYIVQ